MIGKLPSIAMMSFSDIGIDFMANTDVTMVLNANFIHSSSSAVVS